MIGYRDNDQRDHGYCPVCGKPLSGLTRAARGYCEQHRWQWAEWTPLRKWAEDHDEYVYLRTEQKMDEAS